MASMRSGCQRQAVEERVLEILGFCRCDFLRIGGNELVGRVADGWPWPEGRILLLRLRQGPARPPPCGLSGPAPAWRLRSPGHHQVIPVNHFIPASKANGFSISADFSPAIRAHRLNHRPPGHGRFPAPSGHDAHRVAAGEGALHLLTPAGSRLLPLPSSAGAIIDDQAAHGLQGSGNPALA